MQKHWDGVYETKAPDRVSWFRPHLETSLALIERSTNGNRKASIIDIGGGASTLADDLHGCGYRDITVLDISQAALDLAQQRLGQNAPAVEWIQADVTQIHLPERHYNVWHDRAVFHFLTAPEQRLAYVRNAERAIKPGGHVILGTFGPDGPQKCSGLDVVRYSAESLQREIGPQFRVIESLTEIHQTPFGTTQQFLYCLCVLE